MITPAEAAACLSTAQRKRLAKAEVGRNPPLDLLVLDPPLVREDGSRTIFGEVVHAIAATTALAAEFPTWTPEEINEVIMTTAPTESEGARKVRQMFAKICRGEK